MLLRRPTVWIFDDDELFVKLFVSQMTKAGSIATGFCRYTDAVLRFTSGRPDMLVLDREMCDIDGTDLGGEFREMGFDGTIVLLSATLDYSAKTAALANRINLLMVKPPDYHVLQELAVESAIKHRKPLFGILQI